MKLHARWRVAFAVVAILASLAAVVAQKPASTRPGSSSLERIDQHALGAPPDAEKSLDALARYLVQTARTDREKTRAIFRWITDRIAYDADVVLDDKSVRAETVLQRRRGVCEGYSNLFLALAKLAGVEAAKVGGYCKDRGFVPGTQLSKENHAWNAVRLDGKWHLLDCTWAAGVTENKSFKKEYDESYYLTAPDQFIYSHLPTDAKWQLLDRPITQADFQKWPWVSPKLFAMGVTGQTIRAKLEEKGFRDVVLAFGSAKSKLILHAGPIDGHLRPGGKYSFRIDAPGMQRMAFVSNGQFQYLRQKGTVFEGVVQARKGSLSISGQPVSRTKVSFEDILQYVVD